MVSWPHMIEAWAKHAVNTGEWCLFMAVGSGESETTYPGLKPGPCWTLAGHHLVEHLP